LIIFQMNNIENIGPKGTANFFLFCLAFCVSICLFFDQPTFASETIEFKLAWDANTEADLDGYQIYFRDGISGSVYQMIGDVHVDELVDPDNPMHTVTAELTDNSKYYFAITASDTHGKISDFSEEACAEITGSTVTACRVDEIIGYGGAWASGVWYWDESISKWAQMTSDTPGGDIAAGDFTGDGKADVVSIFDGGLWYQDGATLDWTKVTSTTPDSLTAGDVNGDGRSEIIGTWSSGIWYWDVAASNWTQMTSNTPDGDIAAGDFTGDGKADVASIFDGGLWYQDGATLDWTKVTSTTPDSLTAGVVTGK
jgi:hypothetical protein